jgi:hypothetical protein
MWRYLDLFNDPTPDGLINQRYLMTMMRLVNLTELKADEKKRFFDILLLVAKKLVATWKHFNAYSSLEDSLIEKAQASIAIEKQTLQHISYSQDLFLEMDEFLYQVKSTLDYMVKLPVPLVGRGWNVSTFGDKGGTIRKALRRNLPRGNTNSARLIEEQVLDPHKQWLEMIIQARDRLAHFLQGGASFEAMIVIKTLKDDEETIHVPMWDKDTTMRIVMETTFHNLLKLVEDFTAGFLTIRMKPGINVVHIPVEIGSVKSPWVPMTMEQFATFEDKDAALIYGDI